MRLLLYMSREHFLGDLLRLVVGRLAKSPRVALARIWLVQKSEDCTGWPMMAECPGRSLCLHLAASAGRGGHIRLAVERQCSDVLVSVQDDGMGVAADQSPGIYHLFSRVEGVLERSRGGLVTGLTLVKRLVELHGGGSRPNRDVGVESL